MRSLWESLKLRPWGIDWTIARCSLYGLLLCFCRLVIHPKALRDNNAQELANQSVRYITYKHALTLWRFDALTLFNHKGFVDRTNKLPEWNCWSMWGHKALVGGERATFRWRELYSRLGKRPPTPLYGEYRAERQDKFLLETCILR